MDSAPDITALKKRLNGYVIRARGFLYWERFAPVFALSFLLIAVFLIGAFSGLWERIGDPWRLILLLVALGFIIKSILTARRIKRPSRSEAQRRVETDSDTPHRPLDVLEDRAALSQAVWPAHLDRAMGAAKTLRPAVIRPSLAPMDRYYLRFVMPVFLILAMMMGAGDNFDRLRRAFSPSWQSGINPSDVIFEAWADPPEYTGRPPLYFKEKTRLEIPAGSEMVARISGVKDAPRLKITTQKGSRYLRLVRLGPESFESRIILDKDATARWRVGTYEQKWSLNVLPDIAPTVAFDETPKADKQDRLGLSYSFEDDYGVEKFELEMRLLSEDPVLAALRNKSEISLGGGQVKRAENAKHALDLTKHEWAGRKVAARLWVTDGMGQSGFSEESFFTVPDKIFVEPLAKAISENRKLVMAGQDPYVPEIKVRRDKNSPVFDTFEPDERLKRAPENIQTAALYIDALTDQPGGVFKDPAVFLGLAHIHRRLRYAKSQKELEGLPDELWRIAIRAEFGILGTALEDMRKAELALREGMARRAPQREVDTLFDRYNEAVERYTEELRRKAIEEGNIAEGGAGGDGGQSRNMDEIEALLKAIEEANRMGDVAGARKALARLAELLENMEIQLSQGGGSGSGEGMPGEMSEEMKKSLEELADLLGEQRELQDETRQAENQAENESGDQSGNGDGQGSGSPEDGEAPSLTPGELAKQQQQINEALEDLKGSVGEAMTELEKDGKGAGSLLGEEDGEGGSAPGDEGDEQSGDGEGESAADALARAGRAMEDSQNRLRSGDLEGADAAQGEAIQALRQAGKQLAESSLGEGQQGQSADGSENGSNNPLGQNNNGENDDSSEADIDSRDNAKRARELMEELRRRAAEQERDKAEREYLERLLKRF